MWVNCDKISILLYFCHRYRYHDSLLFIPDVLLGSGLKRPLLNCKNPQMHNLSL